MVQFRFLCSRIAHIMRLLSLLIGVVPVLGSKAQRKKVGHDIHLADTFHPWDNNEGVIKERPGPASPQHRVSQHILGTITQGSSLDAAIEEFETFSSSEKLAMSLGHEKGGIIEAAVTRSIVHKKLKSIAFLEFGSHIGDGTLRIIRQLSNADSAERCIVFSFESNQQWLGIGTSLVRHVLQNSKTTACQYVPMSLTDIGHICDHIEDHYDISTVQGIFFDHMHANFFDDIKTIQRKNMLGDGTLIIADNALVHKREMTDFINYMEVHSSLFQLVNVAKPYSDQVLVSEWKDRKNRHSDDEL